MKYKVGDKVRIIKKVHGHGFNIGEIVTINKVGSDDYDVSNDNNDAYWVNDREVEGSGKTSKKVKAPFTNSKMLNLISLKAEPTFELDGNMIPRPQGTLYSWDKDESRWVITSTNLGLTIQEYEANKKWYKLTTELSKEIIIGDEKVTITKEGVDVGCQFIPRNVVLEIAKRLRATK